MAIVVPTAAMVLFLNRWNQNGKTFGTSQVRLFANDVYPAAADTLADYDFPTFPGYSPKTPNVVTGIGEDGRPMRAMYATWIRGAGTGDYPVFGWLWSSAGGAQLIAAERFAEPRILSIPNQTILVSIPFLFGNP